VGKSGCLSLIALNLNAIHPYMIVPSFFNSTIIVGKTVVSLKYEQLMYGKPQKRRLEPRTEGVSLLCTPNYQNNINRYAQAVHG